jgi:hypothetical protein
MDRCPHCNYLLRRKTVCDLCEKVLIVEEVKVYQMPRQSKKQKEIKAKDLIYYRECFEISNKVCLECGEQLGSKWDPYFCAHIITKKGDCPQRWDFRNHVILCPCCHNKFDSEDRTKMKIYPETERVRQELNLEYHTK